MKVLILDTAEAAIARTADIVCDTVRARPDAVLGLATGGTMLPLYAELGRRHAAGDVSLRGATTFNLDEFVGPVAGPPLLLPPLHARRAFRPDRHSPARTHLPNGASSDPVAEAVRYEARIAAAGGLDLQLLGIGRNGHIGFNEPTSSLASHPDQDPDRGHAAGEPALLPDLRRDAAPCDHHGHRDHPRLARLPSAGDRQRQGARCGGPDDRGPARRRLPASALQLHPRATIVLDAAAAGELALTDYYETVHPGGRESAFD